MLRVLKATMKVVNTLVEYITAVMLLIMTLVILFQVLCRMFGTGYDFTEELARYLLVGIVLLGAGIGVHRGGNIGIEAVINAVPPVWQRILAVIMNLCCILLFSEMIRYGWRAMKIASRQISPSMQISMVIPYGVVFVGTILVFLHLVVQLLDLLFNWKPRPTETEEA